MEARVDFLHKRTEEVIPKSKLVPISWTVKGPTGYTTEPSHIVQFVFLIKEDRKKYPDDFIFLAKLGAGQFGEVLLVKDKRNM